MARPPATSRRTCSAPTTSPSSTSCGALTFRELDRSHQRLANSLAAAGVREGDGVGVMCRNHRGFVEATVAVAKLGADVLYLNTAFAGPQLAEVVERESPRR